MNEFKCGMIGDGIETYLLEFNKILTIMSNAKSLPAIEDEFTSQFIIHLIIACM